jgi:hypothetical protein
MPRVVGSCCSACNQLSKPSDVGADIFEGVGEAPLPPLLCDRDFEHCAPAVSRRLSLFLVGTMLRLRIGRVDSPLAVHLLCVSIVANDDIRQVSMSTKCLALPDYALPYCGEAASLSTAVLGAPPREADFDHHFGLYYV